MRFTVLGAGLQGSACAFDLLQDPAVTEVCLADRSFERLPAFLQPLVGSRLTLHAVDARDPVAVGAVVQGTQAALCAMPYHFNSALARVAVEHGVHFADLGGNTAIVEQQIATLHDAAVARGVSVLPDCGLAPGLVNVIAELGIQQCDTVSAVRLYVGGLPQHPSPPLNYQIVYSLEGVLDYYTTPSWVLRDGQPTQVTALSEIEAVSFDGSVGTLEAFHTAGGLSLMAQRYAGRIPVMEYKTLRYPGHAALMAAIRELGFLSNTAVDVNGKDVVPRALAIAVLDPKLRKPNAPDLVALRVEVDGVRGGTPVQHRYELVDHYDAAHGISAMMRTTGYSLAIMGQLMAAGRVAPGVRTPDVAVPGEVYLDALRARGVDVRTTTRAQ
jgi:lysine 6-dehydrogenase